MPETLDQKIRASFDRQSLMATFGVRIDSIGDGLVILSAPIQPNALQQHGYAHAGLTFSLADSAAGYAALTLMPHEAEVLTAEIKINLLAPASGDRLEATGRVIKAGRRLVIVQSDVHAITGDTRRHVAIAQGTMIPVTTS